MGIALVIVALVVIIVTFVALDYDRRHRKEQVLSENSKGNPGVEGSPDGDGGSGDGGD